MNIQVLKKLGFSDKAAKIYLALLQLGPSSVRKIAEYTQINRGTAYDLLKWLQEEGLVNFYKTSSKQHFVAESPDRLYELIQKKQKELSRVDKELEKMVPELVALHHKGGERPVARYFKKDELHLILEDILETCEDSEEKEYRIYSAEGLREYLYEQFPTFSDVRVAKGIEVRVIALGEGGELRGLDERKWMKQTAEKPTYIIMYKGKTAYISLDAKDEPIGVVIENQGVYSTQKILFEQIWHSL